MTGHIPGDEAIGMGGGGRCTTMRQLAKLAGCSVNTVSLALRDSPRVAAETGARVRELARRHGYRPHPLVSAFVTSRRQKRTPLTLAVLTKFAPGHDWGSFGPHLWRGMASMAEELGFRLEEFETALPDSPGGDRLTQILVARGIRGVVLFPSGDFTVDFPHLDWRHFAVVGGGFHAKMLAMHRTASDHVRAMEICLEELTARGYERIGFAVTERLDPRLRLACSGRFFAWQARQPARRRIPVIPEDTDEPTRESFLKWGRRHRPDCIISLEQVSPEWVDELATDFGRHVGLAKLALRDDPRSAGVDMRVEDVGRTTISVLARELYLNHFGLPKIPEVILVSGIWRDGISVRPRF